MSDIRKITGEKSMNYWTNEDGSTDTDKYNSLFNPANEIMELWIKNVQFREQLVTLTS